ncbi:MAG TPA: molybdopterin-dependent oxidoreductase [Candidatus Acidoferrales bacterium]|jgi:DMSO/TMAO reductase YedYZ molybdopterin-dependent catalytic subunit|nr:molybdopterin-dependent oxidoreductase [Candidatus Acidoferrales bacterium]
MKLQRREFLGGLVLGGGALLDPYFLSAADEKVVPFAGTQPFNPERPGMIWDNLTSWSTPTEQLFAVGHYPIPEVDTARWQLDVGGLVSKSKTFSLDELKSRPKTQYNALLECSGNAPAGSLIGNVHWSGTLLAPLLKECGIRPAGIEIVFFGADSGTEKIRDADYKQNFARSLSAEDALKNHIILAYELNGQPIPKNHGGPLRLAVPGWYGVAWVKWVNRIEVHDRKYQGRFMARDYVTIRGEKRGDETIWRETLVGRMNLKSVPARAVRRPDGDIRLTGAAWSDGTPIKTVEVKIDDGPWKPAELVPNRETYTWTFWSLTWPKPAAGEHTIASRATDAHRTVQLPPDDAWFTLKKTRWENNQQAIRKIRIDG